VTVHKSAVQQRFLATGPAGDNSLKDTDNAEVLSSSLSSPTTDYLVIPEGALVVKAALLEEEHDFGAAGVLST
jgi:hypothetical protein